MPAEKFYDVPGGDTISLEIIDEETGYRQPVFRLPPEGRLEQFKSIAELKCRDEDIFLASYPKTGTNWVWEMMLLAINKQPAVSGGNKGGQMIETLPTGALDGTPSPRILNSHLIPKYIPKEVVTKKIRTVLICRNPKDVAVSFYNHTKGVTIYEYDGKFENYLEMFMRGDTDYGSYADYLLDWQTFIRDHPELPIHIAYYEDLKENCLEEMKKLVAFLCLDVEMELLEQIVDNCHMSKIKDSKIKAMEPKMMQMFKNVLKDGFTIYRKGVIGDWKNWFTVAQNERFEAWWEEKTKPIDMFKFRYE